MQVQDTSWHNQLTTSDLLHDANLLHSGTVARASEFSHTKTGSNAMLCQTWASKLLYIAPVHSAMAIGGYLCMNNLCALIVAWLDTSQRS